MTEADGYFLKIVLWVFDEAFRSNRNVEVASQVHAIDSVEACPVQIEKANRPLHRILWARCANAVIEGLAMLALKARKASGQFRRHVVSDTDMR